MAKVNWLTVALILALCLGMSESIMAQVKDVTGWGKLRWGMTEKQAAKKVGKIVLDVPSTQGHLSYAMWGDTVVISGLPFATRFTFAKGSGGLLEIELLCENNPDVAVDCHDLEALMMKKYGSPKLTTGNEAEKMRRWIFRSGTINLFVRNCDYDRSIVIAYAAATRDIEKL
jgi:hypothetical protein